MQSFRSGPANLGAAGLGRKAMQTRPLAPPRVGGVPGNGGAGWAAQAVRPLNNVLRG